MAAALIVGRVGLTELTDEFVRRPDVQSLMKRVKAVADERPNPKRPGFAISDQIVIALRDGRRLDTGPIAQIRGDADLPLSRDELERKFEDCLRAGDPRLSSKRLFDALISLEQVPHARGIDRA